ncbi:hypothetical protein PF007_g3749 [Phytophthora fragariae]|uniref:Uncharacterized protein n=1 Tax=Phytophthora fragariae TaxID=53985 RepID=A0A6A3TA34_9STRA|nr:hypothetical protein PF003_g24796 [Phytophthora fragariae]KAE9132327.1 hypothetical protein PF007_g3749 [Phytophthora fragariae]
MITRPGHSDSIITIDLANVADLLEKVRSSLAAMHRDAIDVKEQKRLYDMTQQKGAGLQDIDASWEPLKSLKAEVPIKVREYAATVEDEAFAEQSNKLDQDRRRALGGSVARAWFKHEYILFKHFKSAGPADPKIVRQGL